jgi:hypothetical protein
LLFDDKVPEDVFEIHLHDTGQYIGIGRFRPERGGYYGRFAVVSIKWEEGAE